MTKWGYCRDARLIWYSKTNQYNQPCQNPIEEKWPDHTIDVQKASDKTQHPNVNKNAQKTKNRRDLYNLMKNICTKTYTIIVLNGERLNAFPQDWEQARLFTLITAGQHSTWTSTSRYQYNKTCTELYAETHKTLEKESNT